MNAAVLCSGIGGAELALEALGCNIAWHAEVDPNAVAVHAAHWPGVPNVGDITTADWSTVPPVDLLHASYPCQPFSMAGQREGLDDERNLWPAVRRAIADLGPRWVVLENVRGHLTLGFDAVLGDLADLGFDVEWGVLGSADVGGCHRRDRLWVVAADPGRRAEWTPAERVAGGGGAVVAGLDRAPAADAGRDGREGASGPDRRRAEVRTDFRGDADRRPVPSDAVTLLPTPTRADGNGGPGSDGRDGGVNLRTAVQDFGRYQAAVDRWAAIFGPPPPPTEPNTKGGRRLHAPFPEWMMGFPAGWATDLVPRAAALKAIGNAVQPQTAVGALAQLIGRHLDRQAVAA